MPIVGSTARSRLGWAGAGFAAALESGITAWEFMMFSQRVSQVMQGEQLLTAAPETTVIQAAQSMAENGVGAILVVESDTLAGIFTERDAVYRVIARGLDTQTTRLAEVMTRSPQSVAPGMTYGQALHLMHRHGIRHLPVVDNGRPVGIVSGRGALDPELEEFVCEAQRREGYDADLPAGGPALALS